ncbi:hypothetical protein CLOP_g7493 [Closterium sp. NIES-67]|nr:hypothetical protein CLOP_g7493 [Closterium sp. NIES-67]
MASSLSIASSTRVFSVQAVTAGRVQRRVQITCSFQPRKANRPAASSGNAHHLSPFYAEKSKPTEEDVDRAYWTDDDVSPVLLQDDETTWQDSNYVDLTMRSYKIVREETQHALQSHFLQQQKHEAANTAQSHHMCCAPTPSHTFCCGEDDKVAQEVSPACVHGGDVFYGTSH